MEEINFCHFFNRIDSNVKKPVPVTTTDRIKIDHLGPVLSACF